MPQVVPSDAKMRKCATVPVALALASDHVPDLALAPDDAAAHQSLSSVIDASSVPLLAVATVAGGPPVRRCRTAAVPMVVSRASRAALRHATDSWTVMAVRS